MSFAWRQSGMNSAKSRRTSWGSRISIAGRAADRSALPAAHRLPARSTVSSARSVEHQPVATPTCSGLLVEPNITVNTVRPTPTSGRQTSKPSDKHDVEGVSRLGADTTVEEIGET